MLGTGLGFNRSRNGDDRFYSTARGRLNQEYQEVAPASPSPVSESFPICNLERFLEAVTPSVSEQYLSKMTTKNWRTGGAGFQPFFVLSDLWESFKEWSAYGAGVPLILNDTDSVVQYYVPYLSAIQLYADLSRSNTTLRRLGEESDGKYFRDSSSAGSCDSEQDRDCFDHSSDQHKRLQEGFSSDEGEPEVSQGCLLFEYLARDPPFCREPLAEKISDLARQFPELKTLRSCDLLPSSWISVAWYPIYRIPTGPTLKDMDACFLTFHSLHTPISGNEAIKCPAVSETDNVPRISLPVFGLASYKYKESLWTPNSGLQCQLANSLLLAAGNWLNLLQVNHPDFSFFSRR